MFSSCKTRVSTSNFQETGSSLDGRMIIFLFDMVGPFICIISFRINQCIYKAHRNLSLITSDAILPCVG